MFGARSKDKEETVPTMRQAMDMYFFLKNADKKMNAVIEPVMREIAERLHSQGQESVIAKQCQALSSNGNLQHRNISLILVTGNKRPACNVSSYPAIAFVANSDRGTLWVRERSIGPDWKKERSTGEYQIDAITRQLVEKHIITWLHRLSAKSG